VESKENAVHRVYLAQLDHQEKLDLLGIQGKQGLLESQVQMVWMDKEDLLVHKEFKDSQGLLVFLVCWA